MPPSFSGRINKSYMYLKHTSGFFIKGKHIYEMLSQLFIIVLSFGSILNGYFIEIKFSISDLFAYFERALKYFEEII